MKCELFFQYAIVEMKFLKILGWLLTRGTKPVHCRIYWSEQGDNGLDFWLAELVSCTPGPNNKVVGVGDGYTIQKTKIRVLPSTVYFVESLSCDSQVIHDLVDSYASIKNGNLNGTQNTFEREWFDSPQGFGGPMYDTSVTSNTFASWVMRSVCRVMPEKPSGAIGWNAKPKFPGPKTSA